MALHQIPYKGGQRSEDDLIRDIEWDIEHGLRESASDELRCLGLYLLEVDDVPLKTKFLYLNDRLESPLPSRSENDDIPAASSDNQPQSLNFQLTDEQERQILCETMIEIIDLRDDNKEYLFNSQSLWKAVFLVCVKMGFCDINEYAKFEKLAMELRFDDIKVFRIPFKKSSIDDLSQPRYKQFLKPTEEWTDQDLTGTGLGFARKMIIVKNKLIERLTAKGVAC